MKKLPYGLKLFGLISFRMQTYKTSISETYHLIKNFHFVYLLGKLMIPHLLRYQGVAVDDDS